MIALPVSVLGNNFNREYEIYEKRSAIDLLRQLRACVCACVVHVCVRVRVSWSEREREEGERDCVCSDG